MKADPKLRIVLKEFPVLGQGSVEAAQVAVAVSMQDKTGKKYLEFHQKLLTGRGQVDKAARSRPRKRSASTWRASKRTWPARKRARALEESLKLAEAIGLNGTPSYVVGNDVVIGAVGQPRSRRRSTTPAAASRPAEAWAGALNPIS